MPQVVLSVSTARENLRHFSTGTSLGIVEVKDSSVFHERPMGNLESAIYSDGQRLHRFRPTQFFVRCSGRSWATIHPLLYGTVQCSEGSHLPPLSTSWVLPSADYPSSSRSPGNRDMFSVPEPRSSALWMAQSVTVAWPAGAVTCRSIIYTVLTIHVSASHNHNGHQRPTDLK